MSAVYAGMGGNGYTTDEVGFMSMNAAQLNLLKTHISWQFFNGALDSILAPCTIQFFDWPTAETLGDNSDAYAYTISPNEENVVRIYFNWFQLHEIFNTLAVGSVAGQERDSVSGRYNLLRRPRRFITDIMMHELVHAIILSKCLARHDANRLPGAPYGHGKIFADMFTALFRPEPCCLYHLPRLNVIELDGGKKARSPTRKRTLRTRISGSRISGSRISRSRRRR